MWTYFVAIGDSFTEGIGDSVEGVELKSWAEHFASLHEPKIPFTNLAKRGLFTKEILLTQLDEAIKLKPQLVSLIAGANDILKGNWNAHTYRTDLEYMIEQLSKSNASIMLGNLPNFTAKLPLHTEQKQIVKHQLLEANEIVFSLCKKYDLYHLDFWEYSLNADALLWSKDLVHPNSKGYQEIAKVVYEVISNKTQNTSL